MQNFASQQVTNKFCTMKIFKGRTTFNNATFCGKKYKRGGLLKVKIRVLFSELMKRRTYKDK
jgi:hypothetical protein